MKLKAKHDKIPCAVLDALLLIGGAVGTVFVCFLCDWWRLCTIWFSDKSNIRWFPASIMFLFVVVVAVAVFCDVVSSDKLNKFRWRDRVLYLLLGIMSGATIALALAPLPYAVLSYNGIAVWCLLVILILVIYIIPALKTALMLRNIGLYISVIGIFGSISVIGLLSSVDYKDIPWIFAFVALLLLGVSFSGFFSWYMCYSTWGEKLSIYLGEAIWGHHLVKLMFPEEQVNESVDFSQFKTWPQPIKKELLRYDTSEEKYSSSRVPVTDFLAYGMLTVLIIGVQKLSELQETVNELGLSSPVGVAAILIGMPICGVCLSIRNTYHRHLERMARELTDEVSEECEIDIQEVEKVSAR